MKKIIYIFVCSLVFTCCNSFFQPTCIDPKVLPPSGQSGQATLVHIQSGAQSYAHASVHAPAKASTTANSSDSQYKELYKTIFSNGTALNIYLKDTVLYLTSSKMAASHTAFMKEIKTDSGKSSKLLVNRENTLPKDYSPKELTKISPKEVKLEYSDLKLAPTALKALYTMIEAAKKDGIKGFLVNSAYRSVSSQQQIFDYNLNSFRKSSKTEVEAFAKTRQLVALPGNSEHHTGLALDLFSINGRHRTDFEGTKEQVWLSKNLADYGFILRYPRDKTEITECVYEPWHIRYVGKPLSLYIKENNLCLEEFYNKIFRGEVLRDDKSIFLLLPKEKTVFCDKALLSKAVIEKINENNSLLTVNLF